MTAIDDLIQEQVSNRTTDYTQNFAGQVTVFIAALREIQGGLVPSGPQAANTFLGGPTAGAPAASTYRLLAAADLAAITSLQANQVLYGSATGGATQSNLLNWDFVNGGLSVGGIAASAPMTVNNNGIVTAPPSGTLFHGVSGSFGVPSSPARIVLDAFASFGGFDTRRAQGTRAAPTALTTGLNMNSVGARGWDGAAFILSGDVNFQTTENWAVGANGTQLIVSTTPIGSAAPVTSLTLQSTSLELPAASRFGLSGRSQIQSGADGNVMLSNAALNSFSLLQLGGITNAYPALKRVGNAVQFRLADDSGDAGITAAQITFTGGAVALNDYEVGTWTPTLAGVTVAGTQTYSTQLANYVKVGRDITVACRIVTTAIDAATNGNLRLNGLPFTSAVMAGGMQAGIALGDMSNFTLTALYFAFVGRIAANSTGVLLAQTGSANATTPLTQTALPAAACTLVIGGSYETNT